MKDPKSSYNKDAFEELLRQFMLEESANDLEADAWMEREAERAYNAPVKHTPPAAREQELIETLNQKLQGAPTGGGSTGLSVWKLLVLGGVLFIAVGIWLWLDADKDKLTADGLAALPVTTVLKPRATQDTFNVGALIRLSESVYQDGNPMPGIAPERLLTSNLSEVPNNSNAAGATPPAKKGLLKELKRKLAQYTNAIPAERLFVQTDRRHYLPGQTVWLTAFLRNETDLTPSNLSELVILELMDAKGQIIFTSQVVAQNGTGSGQLDLPRQLPRGSYTLHAYTAWQQAAGQPGSSQQLSVFGQQAGVAATAQAGTQVNFYPEGGYLVAGFANRLAFTLSDKGKPLNTLLEIFDEMDNPVVAARPLHEGRGMLELQPEPGASYYARVNGERYNLPIVLPEGLVMEVAKPQQGQVGVTIQAAARRKVLLVGTLRGSMYFAAEHHLKPGSNSISIPVDNMPGGVLQLSLFDEAGVGHAERLVFVNRHKQLQVYLSPSKTTYQPREQVELMIKVTDEKGRPVQGQFALAVTDADQQNREDIRAGLLLQPDLKEPVANAARYFDPGNAKATEQLDLLLLTAGWRRFSWAEVYYNRYEAPSTTPAKAVVSGVVVDATSGRPLSDIKIQNRVQGIKATTGADGRFTIKGAELSAPLDLVFSTHTGMMTDVVNQYTDNLLVAYAGDGRTVFQPQASGQVHPSLAGGFTDTTYLVVGQVIDAGGLPVPRARITATFGQGITSYAQTDKDGFYTLGVNQLGKGKLLVEVDGYASQRFTVEVEEQKLVLLNVRITSRNGYEVSQAAHPYAGKGYQQQHFGNIAGEWDAAHTDVPAPYKQPADVKGWGGAARKGSYVLGREVEYNRPLSIPLASLSAQVPQDNKVPGAYNLPDWPAGSIATKPKGFDAMYTQPRTFPEISYGARDKNLDRTDLRATLYWQGQLLTGPDGLATVRFTTSDQPGTFAVQVQGISSSGMPGCGIGSLRTDMPYQLLVSAPAAASVGQTISVPISFTNVADKTIPGQVRVASGGALKAMPGLPDAFTLFPYRNDTINARFKVEGPVGADTLRVTFEGYGYTQTVSRVVKVLPRQAGD